MAVEFLDFLVSVYFTIEILNDSLCFFNGHCFKNLLIHQNLLMDLHLLIVFFNIWLSHLLLFLFPIFILLVLISYDNLGYGITNEFQHSFQPSHFRSFSFLFHFSSLFNLFLIFFNLISISNSLLFLLLYLLLCGRDLNYSRNRLVINKLLLYFFRFLDSPFVNFFDDVIIKLRVLIVFLQFHLL